MGKRPVIGLFGTCDGVAWRDEFIAEYQKRDIKFYNPMKADWKPEDSAEEALHLVQDDIILFPVLAESYGVASLAEIGYSILNAARSKTERFTVVLIDADVTDKLKEQNPLLAKHTRNARAIVKAHLSKLDDPNVFVVSDLEQMKLLSIVLHDALCASKAARVFYQTLRELP